MKETTASDMYVASYMYVVVNIKRTTETHQSEHEVWLPVKVTGKFPFGFEGRIWDLIVSVPDHCLSFYC